MTSFVREVKGKAGLLAGSTLLVNRAAHRNRTILFDQLAGSVCTLPRAIGSGMKARFIVHVLATSVSHQLKVGNGTDVFRGIVSCLDSNLATVNMFGFFPGASDDTITLDRVNTGSVTLGEWLEVEDIATGFWHVRGMLSGLAPATPFSNTVS